MNEKETGIHVDDAWNRFVEAHKTEPVSPVWGKLNEAGLQAVPHRAVNRRPEKKRAASRWMGRSIAAALAIVVGVGLFTPAGDRVFAAMMDTFRIGHLQTVEISDNDITKLQEALAGGNFDQSSFDLQQYGQVELNGDGRSIQSVTMDEAVKLAGAPLKRLADNGGEVTYQSAFDVTMKLNVDSVNRFLTRLGGKVKFPADADGKPIAIHMPEVVYANLNGAAAAADGANTAAYKFLQQSKLPSLDVPAGIDVDQVRKAVLNLPFLTDELRGKLEAIQDWKSTLPVPVLTGSSREVKVAGNDAVLANDHGDRSIIWLDGEWLYRLSGSTDAYPTEDDLIQDAERIAAQ
ncbi:hypothetical protein [Gorillibacterium massiliense]|uniref:hypothetical protein n=1 Tax=Gorillibacterium massiliense TaxID=1280390 RepID=UPI0004BCC9AA|nr:hypothetical protein [Gorillibacterium massiliense]